MKKLLLCTVFAALLLPAYGQPVSRMMLSSSYTFDGLFAAPDGSLYAAGGYNSDTIYELYGDVGVTPFATGIDGPIHLAMNSNGELFVSSFNNQTIYRVNGGNLETYAVTLIRYPTSMVFGPDGALYVAHAEPAYGTGGISRIETDGTASIFARGSGIDRPVGLAIDEDGNLYAANYYDTAINKISPAGEITPFSNTLPQVYSTTIGALVYADGYIYGTDVGHHQIVRFDMNGTMEVFAGNGDKAIVDGSFSEAAFSNPKGLALSPDGSKLYVASERSQSHIRVVSLAAATDTETDHALPSSVELSQNYPNPFNPTTAIGFELDQSEPVQLSVFDLMGRRVATLIDATLEAGSHEVRFDASGLAGGTYMYRLRTNAGSAMRTMTLLK